MRLRYRTGGTVKITTLIPAYKTQYQEELLSSLLHQTMPPNKVIISDDSPGQAFTQMLRTEPMASRLGSLDLEVLEGPQRGGMANYVHLLRTWGGATELVHILMDDDLIYPEFYERHFLAHATRRFPCTISRRWTARESGLLIGSPTVPRSMATHANRMIAVSADQAFATTLPQRYNWFGEVSNAVFRAEMAETLETVQIDGISFRGLEDLGAFLVAGLETPFCFLNDFLGAFRQNPHQHSADLASLEMKLSNLAWVPLAIVGRRRGLLSGDKAAECFTQTCTAVGRDYYGQADLAGFNAVLPALASGNAEAEEQFLDLWSHFIRGS